MRRRLAKYYYILNCSFRLLNMYEKPQCHIVQPDHCASLHIVCVCIQCILTVKTVKVSMQTMACGQPKVALNAYLVNITIYIVNIVIHKYNYNYS